MRGWVRGELSAEQLAGAQLTGRDDGRNVLLVFPGGPGVWVRREDLARVLFREWPRRRRAPRRRSAASGTQDEKAVA